MFSLPSGGGPSTRSVDGVGRARRKERGCIAEPPPPGRFSATPPRDGEGEGDANIPVSQLSGGQKARLQLITMLADSPQLLVLDEPTNHLDLPSIEVLENALNNYTGAVLYISHDTFLRKNLNGEVMNI